MIELPEALNLAKQLNKSVAGKTVSRVLPPTKPHKFCWFHGDAAQYNNKINGSSVVCAEGFGIYAEMTFDNGYKLCINDGVNLRLTAICDVPKDYQLLIEFTDKSALVFTVAMYGGIVLHFSDYDNEYYLKSRSFISPFSDEFEKHFFNILAESKPSLSAKAFLATEQRFPGIGNGVAQDILFEAGINPKSKILSLSRAQHNNLLDSITTVLRRMTDSGGRDTEKDIYGNNGGYVTKMSKNAINLGCPQCGGEITKEAFLGGSVYYCKLCQPIVK